MTCSLLATLDPASEGPTMLVPYILMGFGICLCVVTLLSLMHGWRTMPIVTMVLGLALGIAGGSLLFLSNVQAAGVGA